MLKALPPLQIFSFFDKMKKRNLWTTLDAMLAVIPELFVPELKTLIDLQMGRVASSSSLTNKDSPSTALPTPTFTTHSTTRTYAETLSRPTLCEVLRSGPPQKINLAKVLYQRPLAPSDLSAEIAPPAPPSAADPPPFSCGVCFEPFVTSSVLSYNCGHLLCKQCDSTRRKEICPFCQVEIVDKRKIFF